MKNDDICKTCEYYKGEDVDCDHLISSEKNLDYCQYKPKEEKT